MTLLLIFNTRPFCFFQITNLKAQAVSAVKLLQYVIANLNLKGLSSYTHCTNVLSVSVQKIYMLDKNTHVITGLITYESTVEKDGGS